MMDDQPAETQQELFQEFSTAPKKPERFPSIAKSHKPILISTTLEQVLLVSIISVLVLCGVFFVGVLRGKGLRGVPMEQTPQVAVPQTRMPANAVTVSVPVRSASGASVADKPYTLQVMTYRKKEYAEVEAAKIRKLGHMSFILSNGEYFAVCVGQYASKEEARTDRAYFLSRYKDCFLRRR